MSFVLMDQVRPFQTSSASSPKRFIIPHLPPAYFTDAHPMLLRYVTSNALSTRTPPCTHSTRLLSPHSTVWSPHTRTMVGNDDAMSSVMMAPDADQVKISICPGVSATMYCREGSRGFSHNWMTCGQEVWGAVVYGLRCPSFCSRTALHTYAHLVMQLITPFLLS